LRDWIDLRAGENWSDRLKELIHEADVFQLFWSWNSMRSANVQREWEYALSLGRPNFVRPTYWETPIPRDSAKGLPPAALNALHFHRLALGPDLPPAAAAPGMAVPEPALPPPPPPAPSISGGTARSVLSLLIVLVVTLLAVVASLVLLGSPPPGP